MKSAETYAIFIFLCFLNPVAKGSTSISSNFDKRIITCTNNKGVSKLIIGILDDRDEDGEISVAKIVTPDSEYILNKYDVNHIYIANKS